MIEQKKGDSLVNDLKERLIIAILKKWPSAKYIQSDSDNPIFTLECGDRKVVSCFLIDSGFNFTFQKFRKVQSLEKYRIHHASEVGYFHEDEYDSVHTSWRQKEEDKKFYFIKPDGTEYLAEPDADSTFDIISSDLRMRSMEFD